MQYIIQILLMLSIATQQAPPPTPANAHLDKVPVLMYHHMVPEVDLLSERGSDMVVTVEQFAQQLTWLKNQGWQTISTEQLQNYIQNDATLPEKPFMITFDDGYASNYLYALPMLKTLGYTAVEFVITDHMLPAERLYNGRKMSWVDLVNSQGTFEIHNHTHYFHKKKAGKPYLLIYPYQDVLLDLQTAYTIIEKNIPNKRRVFAAPYGGYNQDTLRALKELKTDMAFNIKPGYAAVGTPIYEIPRFTILPTTSMDQFKGLFGVPRVVKKDVIVEKENLPSGQ